jgi:hypothetical protein
MTVRQCSDITKEGGAMSRKKFLQTVIIALCALSLPLFLSGCGKKKPAETKTAAQMAQTGKATDTSDIFKEFYSEDTAAKNKAAAKKQSKQETFSPSSSAAEFDPNGRYTVQISCVLSKSFAEAMVSKMKDKGYPAYVAEVTNPRPDLSGTYYRVRIGGFAGLSKAKSFGETTLLANGYEYWVDNKSNDNVGMEGYGLGSGSAGSSAAGAYQTAPAAPTSTYQSQPSSGSFGTTETSPASSSSSGLGAGSTGSSSSATSGSSSWGSSSTSGTSATTTTGTSATGSSSGSLESTPASGTTGTSTTGTSTTGSSGSAAPSSSTTGTGSTGTGSGSTGSGGAKTGGWGDSSSSGW